MALISQAQVAGKSKTFVYPDERTGEDDQSVAIISGVHFAEIGVQTSSEHNPNKVNMHARSGPGCQINK